MFSCEIKTGGEAFRDPFTGEDGGSGNQKATG